MPSLNPVLGYRSQQGTLHWKLGSFPPQSCPAPPHRAWQSESALVTTVLAHEAEPLISYKPNNYNFGNLTPVEQQQKESSQQQAVACCTEL